MRVPPDEVIRFNINGYALTHEVICGGVGVQCCADATAPLRVWWARRIRNPTHEPCLREQFAESAGFCTTDGYYPVPTGRDVVRYQVGLAFAEFGSRLCRVPVLAHHVCAEDVVKVLIRLGCGEVVIPVRPRFLTANEVLDGEHVVVRAHAAPPIRRPRLNTSSRSKRISRGPMRWAVSRPCAIHLNGLLVSAVELGGLPDAGAGRQVGPYLGLHGLN
jgi:hypothetical protein